MSDKVVLEISLWSTRCGSCQYGGGSWADSPAREGKEPLSPFSTVCHGCGRQFTHKMYVYEPHRGLEPIEGEDTNVRS